MQGNNFNWALAQLKTGNTVTRIEWCDEATGIHTAWLHYPKPAVKDNQEIQVTIRPNKEKGSDNWIASDLDLEATDWIVVTDNT